jgi:hypothetical protein
MSSLSLIRGAVLGPRAASGQEDDLSLLRGLGEKEVKAYARKGILTVRTKPECKNCPLTPDCEFYQRGGA